MAKGKTPRKKRKNREHPTLSENDQAQLEMLLDRVAAQDGEGESCDQFLESLKPLFKRSLPFNLAFVEALGATASPVAVRVLQALQQIPAEKPLRRALKAALFRLSRKGLVRKEEQAEVTPRVLVPRAADRRAEAWAGWPEGSNGERGVILKLPDAGRGYLVVVAVLDPERGFRELQAMQTTRKGVRTLLEEISGGSPGRLVAIPVSHLRFLLEEAAEIQRQQNLALPDEYESIQRYLSSWTEASPRPYTYELLKADEIAGDLLFLRASDSLLDLPPLSSWRLPEEAIRPFAEKIRGLSDSRLVVSQAARQERMEQLIREAAAEIFTPALRQRYRRLLEESAMLFCQEGRMQEARRALAGALDLEREVGRLTENTFILGLVKRSLGGVIEELESAEGQGAGERTTESGLIIPGR
jgi:hypothetical protein